MTHTDNPKESWHLSKEVPIALIGTMAGIIVTVAFGWSNLVSRVENVEKAQSKAEATATITETKFDKKLDKIDTALTELNKQFMQAQIDSARAARR